MQVTITVRHGEIPDALKARAAQVVERLARRAVRPTRAHLTFDSQAQRCSAEIVLNAARGAVHVARADADDHRSALDRVAAKLQRQLDKPVAKPARRVQRKAAAS